MSPPLSPKGFSLVELLITVLIISIIAVWGLPYLQSILAQIEAKKVTSSLTTQIHEAKHRALVYRNRVAICGTNDSENCDHSNWSSGLLVFYDTTPNRKRDPQEKMISHIPLDLKYGSLQWRGFGVNKTILFQSDTGLSRGSNGSFYYCSVYPDQHIRISLSSMGHIRAEKIQNC